MTKEIKMKKCALSFLLFCSIINISCMEKDESSRLSRLIEKNNVDAVRSCLEERADPNMNSGALPPLNEAIFIEQIAMVRLLLEYKADPHLKSNHRGWTALTRAAVQGNADIVKLLLSRSEFNSSEVNEALKESSYGLGVIIRFNMGCSEGSSARSEESDNYQKVVTLLEIRLKSIAQGS